MKRENLFYSRLNADELNLEELVNSIEKLGDIKETLEGKINDLKDDEDIRVLFEELLEDTKDKYDEVVEEYCKRDDHITLEIKGGGKDQRAYFTVVYVDEFSNLSITAKVVTVDKIGSAIRELKMNYGYRIFDVNGLVA